MASTLKQRFVVVGEAFLAVLLCEGIGFLAGWATQTSVTTWYPTLTKPSFTPPNWVFAPVWTVLYAMMGVAAFLVWRRGIHHHRVRQGLALFIVQLLLNAGWSFAFFGTQSPGWGLLVIVLLWGVLVWTTDRFFRIRRSAGWLLVPYLVWVTYAFALNVGIWGLN